MIKKSKAKDVSAFLDWVNEWEALESDRLTKAKRDPSVSQDKAECLRVLAEGTNSLSELKDSIAKLFHDGDDKDRVILSSTHKAKGLERDRVFLLKDTYRPTKSQEESNLLYVGITRAKKELFLVAGK